jgi:hypothetical protein
MLLHARGWSGELVDEGCTALLAACFEGELDGKEVYQLTAAEAQSVLAEQVADDEIRALCAVAEIHDRGDGEGDRLRAALRDLDAFADSLGED